MTELTDPTELKRLCCKRFSGSIFRMVPFVIIFPSSPFQPNEEPTFQSETYSPPICLVTAGSVKICQTLEAGAFISIDLCTERFDINQPSAIENGTTEV